jgi:hypothetical protein
MSDTNENIERTMELTHQLLVCADNGDIEREDDTCGVFYGLVRDFAYKILNEAEKELSLHKKQKGRQCSCCPSNQNCGQKVQ